MHSGNVFLNFKSEVHASKVKGHSLNLQGKEFRYMYIIYMPPRIPNGRFTCNCKLFGTERNKNHSKQALKTLHVVKFTSVGFFLKLYSQKI